MRLIPLLSLSLILAIGGARASWPANHINSLSDIRCRQWCTFRFHSGSRRVFVGPDAELRPFLVSNYVKRMQDRHRAELTAEMSDNMRRFREYYSSQRAGGTLRESGDSTLGWFNLYHDYLHCLRDCFD
ncbi:hypothetical protein BOX15_Mlig019020g2 [Macrostomum lignano]|uniref:Uncharacterized protein n=1 Tax=Macrostomum lignano TaxID=282301 RepID=A0A267DF71_9PLAT|nr:hypothetical protein BOX15_Mlig019020g2 [Macrostomum lignano]